MAKKLACILLCAGTSSRFKTNKLFYEINGQKIIDIALSNIPKDLCEKVVVVSSYDEILERAKELSFIPIKNNFPEDGQSLSIKLGLSEVKDCDKAIFMVSDQPLLKKESIEKLIDFSSKNENKIVGLSSYKRPGNPVIFPSLFFEELESLSGDEKGKKIIENHLDDYLTIQVDDIELTDIDTIEDIKKVKEIK